MVGNLGSSSALFPISHCMALGEHQGPLGLSCPPLPQEMGRASRRRHDELATGEGHLPRTPALYTLSLGLVTLLGVSVNIWYHSCRTWMGNGKEMWT